MQQTRSNVEKKLAEFLEKYPVDPPIDVFALANQAGYEVKFFYPSRDPQLPKISGALVYQDKRIFINADEPINRQRFTCAHELGHAVLHEMDMVDKKIDFRVEGESDNREKQANHFAACLLMPEEYLKEIYATLPYDQPIPERVEILARHFKVSDQAMLYRLQNIGLLKHHVFGDYA